MTGSIRLPLPLSVGKRKSVTLLLRNQHLRLLPTSPTGFRNVSASRMSPQHKAYLDEQDIVGSIRHMGMLKYAVCGIRIVAKRNVCLLHNITRDQLNH